MPAVADGRVAFDHGGVVGGFTDRGSPRRRSPYDANLASHVGDDPAAVAAARHRFWRTTGGRRLVFTEQVHGADVLVVRPGLPDGVHELGRADALVSTEPGTALAILVADCLPVLLVDPPHGVVAVVHAGRRGLQAGVLTATLNAMHRLGSSPAETTAVIGPGICGGCYEVPPQLRQQVAAAVPGSAATTRRGTPGLDLRAGARALLIAAGVADIRDDARCTAEDDALHSFRRDGTTGRFAGWVLRR